MAEKTGNPEIHDYYYFDKEFGVFKWKE
jgi:hypothetical protein